MLLVSATELQVNAKVYSHIGIIITAFSSLGSSDRPGYGEADPVLMEEPLIKEIAAKRNCSPAQVCLLSLKRRGWVRCRWTLE
jgi:diketogulonate reductase-like aldo/keto reductase